MASGVLDTCVASEVPGPWSSWGFCISIASDGVGVFCRLLTRKDMDLGRGACWELLGEVKERACHKYVDGSLGFQPPHLCSFSLRFLFIYLFI